MPSFAGVSESSAPSPCRICTRSALAHSGMHSRTAYPLAAPIMAMAMPVLPDVGSRMVLPGVRSPRSSAPAIMLSAGRSLTDPPGLHPSSLQRMWTPGLRQRS